MTPAAPVRREPELLERDRELDDVAVLGDPAGRVPERVPRVVEARELLVQGACMIPADIPIISSKVKSNLFRIDCGGTPGMSASTLM